MENGVNDTLISLYPKEMIQSIQSLNKSLKHSNKLKKNEHLLRKMSHINNNNPIYFVTN